MLNRLLGVDKHPNQQAEIVTHPVDKEQHAAERELNTLLIVASTSLSMTIAGALFYPPLALISSPAIAYTLYPFLQRGYRSLVYKRKITMSVVDCILLPGLLITGHFFATALTQTLLFMSYKLLAKTEDRSQKSLINIFGQQPRTVWVLVDNLEIEIPFDQLKPGDIVVLNAGETVSVDGSIVTGYATIDQHMLTGESRPVEKGPGEQVFAATLVLSGRIHVTVEHAGNETVAARIGDILYRTSDYKLTIQNRGDAVADLAAIPTLVLGAATLPFMGVDPALAILLSSLGYNMRVIAPISLLNFLQIMARSGILVKDGRSLEILNTVDTIVFDKTGTLTIEQPHVRQIHTWSGIDPTALLTIAAAAEYRQSHPIARAIVQAAEERGLKLPDITHARYEVGFGITVELNEQQIHVGSNRFMALVGISVPTEICDLQTQIQAKGHSLVLISIDRQLAGGIELEPALRPEAIAVIKALRDTGKRLYIISGDQEQPTRRLAETLGIPHYMANTLPEEKALIVQRLQQEGRIVCFVGDGINDSIALKQANLSVSLRGATTIATDTAQIVLMDSSLSQLAHLFELAKRFEQNMQINLLTTLIPGVICIGGVWFFHFGVLSAIFLLNIGLAAGVSNAMLPLIQNPINTIRIPAPISNTSC